MVIIFWSPNFRVQDRVHKSVIVVCTRILSTHHIENLAVPRKRAESVSYTKLISESSQFVLNTFVKIHPTRLIHPDSYWNIYDSSIYKVFISYSKNIRHSIHLTFHLVVSSWILIALIGLAPLEENMNPLVPAKNLSTYWLVFLDILANRVPRHFGQQSSTYWPSGPSSDSSTFWKPSRMLKKFLDILAGNLYFEPMVLYFLVNLVCRYVRLCLLRVCTFEIFECLCLFRVCIFKMLLCLCLWRVCVLIFLRCPCLKRVCRQDADNDCLRTRLSVSV